MNNDADRTDRARADDTVHGLVGVTMEERR